MSAEIERIVVALDAASENRAAIGTAARLAARWKAELHGIFVEDDDLIRLADLPFARQVSLGLGVERINLQQTRRQMRAFADRARHELALAAKRYGVKWSFETTPAEGAGRSHSGETHAFMVCSTTTRPIGGHFRVDCRWWSAAEPGTGAFLFSHRDWGEGTVAALLRDQSPASERLLERAARLAEAHDGRLAVICTLEPADAPGFKAWLDDRLAGHAVTVEVDLASPEPVALVQRIVELNCRVIAVAADAAEAHPFGPRDMVAKIDCSVLVVR